MEQNPSQAIAELYTRMAINATARMTPDATRAFYGQMMDSLALGVEASKLGEIEREFASNAADALKVRPLQSFYMAENKLWAQEFNGFAIRVAALKKALSGPPNSGTLGEVSFDLANLGDDLSAVATATREQRRSMVFDFFNDPAKRAAKYDAFADMVVGVKARVDGILEKRARRAV